MVNFEQLAQGCYTKGTNCDPSEQLFPNKRPLAYPNLTKRMKMLNRL